MSLKQGVVFLDAPGGTGKTFLIGSILAKIHWQINSSRFGIIRIASTLLTGTAAHSAFKISPNLIHIDNSE